jgi:xanthine dehydrogenase YagR molybdenum-binding subunit
LISCASISSCTAHGSSQTASIGGAVIAAQRTLVEQLLALADDESPLAGLTVVASAAKPEEAQTYSMHSFGAVFCRVRVNSVTSETRVDRVLGSYDCGRIINPKTARSQFRGGIIMGIGLAHMEDTAFDERTARIMNTVQELSKLIVNFALHPRRACCSGFK